MPFFQREPTRTNIEGLKKALAHSLQTLKSRQEQLSSPVAVLDWEKARIESVGNQLGRAIADQRREREKGVTTLQTFEQFNKIYSSMYDTLVMLANEWDERSQHLKDLRSELTKNQESLSPQELRALKEEIKKVEKSMHPLFKEIEDRKVQLVNFLRYEVPHGPHTQNATKQSQLILSSPPTEADLVYVVAQTFANHYSDHSQSTYTYNDIYNSNYRYQQPPVSTSFTDRNKLRERLEGIEVRGKEDPEIVEKESRPDIDDAWERIEEAQTKSQIPDMKGKGVSAHEIIEPAIEIFQGVNIRAAELHQMMQYGQISVSAVLDEVDEMNKTLQRLRTLADATPNKEVKKIGELATKQMDEVLLTVVEAAAHQIVRTGQIQLWQQFNRLKAQLVSPERTNGALKSRMKEINLWIESLSSDQKPPREKGNDAIIIARHIIQTLNTLNDNSILSSQYRSASSHSSKGEVQYSSSHGSLEKKDEAPPPYVDDEPKQAWRDSLDELNTMQVRRQWQERVESFSTVAESFRKAAPSVAQSIVGTIVALESEQQAQEANSRFGKLKKLKETLSSSPRNIDALKTVNGHLLAHIEEVRQAARPTAISNDSKATIKINEMQERVRISIRSDDEALSAPNAQLDAKQKLDKIPINQLPQILDEIKTLNSSMNAFLNLMGPSTRSASIEDVFGKAELATCMQTLRDMSKQFTSKLPHLTAKAYTVISTRTVSSTQEKILIDQVTDSSRHQGINLDDIHDEGKANRILDALVKCAGKLDVVIIKCNAPSETLREKIQQTLEMLKEKNSNISVEIQGQPEHYQHLITNGSISQVTDTTVNHEQPSILKDHNPHVQGLSRGRNSANVVTQPSEKRRSSSR